MGLLSRAQAVGNRLPELPELERKRALKGKLIVERGLGGQKKIRDPNRNIGNDDRHHCRPVRHERSRFVPIVAAIVKAHERAKVSARWSIGKNA